MCEGGGWTTSLIAAPSPHEPSTLACAPWIMFATDCSIASRSDSRIVAPVSSKKNRKSAGAWKSSVVSVLWMRGLSADTPGPAAAWRKESK